MRREVWVWVHGPYFISNCGNVRKGHTPILAARDRWGYPMVNVNCKDGVRRRVFVHKLVAEAFHGPRPVGHEVNHKNGNKADSRASNLEWVTRSENEKHAYRTGLKVHWMAMPKHMRLA